MVERVGIFLGALAEVRFEDETVLVRGAASGVDATEKASFLLLDFFGLFAALSVFFVCCVALYAVAALLLLQYGKSKFFRVHRYYAAS